jgi:hypothetical protein
MYSVGLALLALVIRGISTWGVTVLQVLGGLNP